MSLTVSRQPASTPRSAPTVKSAAASISTASTPRFDQRSYWPVVGVVEQVARDDRADVQLLADLLRGVHRAVDDDQTRSGSAARCDEVHRGRVGGHRGQRDDQIAERVVRLQPAAGADADQLLAAELDQLLEDDRRAGAAHAGALHRDRLALVGAGVAEQAALGVPLLDVVEVGLGDVLGAQRVAGEENRLGVLARLGANVDRHGAPTLYDAKTCRMATSSSRRCEQVLEFCAREPVERVFLEDVARRGLGRFVALADDDGAAERALPRRRERRAVGAEDCGAFADAAAARRGRA